MAATRYLRRLHKRTSAEAPRSALLLVALFSGTALLTLTALAVISVGGVLGAYMYFAQGLASPDAIANRQIARTTMIYDRNGTLLYEVFDPQGGKRTTVPLSEVSPYVIMATIATEDADFYENVGINLRGVVRAVSKSLEGDVQGGSSITQQLVKNVLIPQEERSQILISRKVREIILAYEITRRYPKDQILQWYLNEIFYGNLSYGIEAAAHSYFGKSARNLNLAESAMLSGIPQAPALYSPLENFEGAKERQTQVLDLMVRQGYIDEFQAEEAKLAPLEFAPQRFPIEAPHWVVYVKDYLERKYGSATLYRGGLKVTTTLDLRLQNLAETIARKQVENLKKNNASNASLVAIRPSTGEILTMMGSIDFFDPKIDGQVNVAMSERQPGSSFKPLTYVTAFMKGYTPSTILMDTPVSYPGATGIYSPLNIDKKFRGAVTIRQALATSLNVPAVRAMDYAGVDNVIQTAHQMGITTLNKKGWYGLALTLGGGEVKLMDMTYAFSVFANNGQMAGVPVLPQDRQPDLRQLDPVAILRIEDGDGKILEEFKAPEVHPVISPQLAYLITDIISDNNARAPLFGFNSALKLSRPAAAKTGTTTDWKDNWTMGYTPDLAVGVWVGNTNGKQMIESFGSTAAAPIWHDFLEAALKDTPPTPFTRPDGIVEVACRGQREVFIQGTEKKGCS